MPNIRNREHFEASWWDWSVYNECFYPTKIRITDVDGLVERRGNFLLIETKMPGASVPTGQSILFDQIAKSSKWNVIVIWGDTGAPQTYQLWGDAKKKASTKRMKAIFRRWFELAESNEIERLTGAGLVEGHLIDALKEASNTGNRAIIKICRDALARFRETVTRDGHAP